VTFLYPAEGDGAVYDSDPVVRSSRSAFGASTASSLGAGCRWTHEVSKRTEATQTVDVSSIGPHVAYKDKLKSGGSLDDASKLIYTIAQHLFSAHLPMPSLDEGSDEESWVDDDEDA
jgi:hypothetical protein